MSFRAAIRVRPLGLFPAGPHQQESAQGARQGGPGGRQEQAPDAQVGCPEATGRAGSLLRRLRPGHCAVPVHGQPHSACERGMWISILEIIQLLNLKNMFVHFLYCFQREVTNMIKITWGLISQNSSYSS